MKLVSMLEQTLRIAIPYLFAAAGGTLAERAGVVSLTLEGFMLAGAFSAVAGGFATGSAWAALLCGALGGLVFAALHALASLRFRADQIVVGVALNLLAIGATRLFLKLVWKSSSNSARVVGFAEDAGATVATFANPLFWLGIAAIPALAWLMRATPFGLRVRAVGEHPKAAETLGVDVGRVRLLAVLGSGVLAGLGGTYLALEQHQFSDEMTAGRGFIALAAVITGSWRPVRAGIACLVFAASETLQMQLQTLAVLPSQILSMMPYLVTLAVLVGFVGRARPPAALGKA
ncbi:MAG TPA: ABC transporter permease [Polyangiaceae bacterium]|jgi:simple sugar transport system permease protein|nr:ABC transporter permease [Polyangiaceae bacterium]